MKTIFTFLACLILTTTGFAQAFSGKTNAIRLDYTSSINATTLPRIVWTLPTAEVTNSAEHTVIFQAEVKSNVALKTLTLEYTNGGNTRSRPIPLPQDALEFNVNQPISLLDGENVVRIVAENMNGGIVSSARTVISGKDAIADAVDINRKDYALIVATDNYDHFTDLTNPVNDATTIDGILKEKYGFQTEILLNPTNDEILAKITDYNVKKFNPQDQLFVFFAGHGTFDADLGEGYLVASNSQLNDKGRGSYISHILVRERLNNIKCEHIFLMMDVCFGGTIDPVLAKARSTDDMDEAADKQFLIKKLTRKTRKFLTSGSKEYVPDGAPGKHSPFAEKFILALKEIGGGSGRILSLSELQTYFLRLSTETRFGGFGTDDPASDFVFVAKQ
jgi:hypothetical protein